MRFRPASFSLAALAAVTCMPALRAQWVTFQDQTSTRLVSAAALGSGDTQEKDYSWADFDQDGDTDLVVMRKQPFTSPGKFPNVLFMNENGVLTDRTAALGSGDTQEKDYSGSPAARACSTPPTTVTRWSST
jgi:hypothetical protein